MLILTRKKDESIIIADNIKIKVLELDNNRVQLGIEAPASITIHREEVYQEIQNENKLAVVKKGKIPESISNLLKKEVNSNKDGDN